MPFIEKLSLILASFVIDISPIVSFLSLVNGKINENELIKLSKREEREASWTLTKTPVEIPGVQDGSKEVNRTRRANLETRDFQRSSKLVQGGMCLSEGRLR